MEGTYLHLNALGDLFLFEKRKHRNAVQSNLSTLRWMLAKGPTLNASRLLVLAQEAEDGGGGHKLLHQHTSDADHLPHVQP